MSIVALVTWIAAAGAGLYLVSIWLIEYDREFQSSAATRLPPVVLVSHVTLALGGLAVWVAYLVNNSGKLVLTAVLALLLAATLGTFMAIRWISVYREARAVRQAATQAAADWSAASAAGTARPLGFDQLAVAGPRQAGIRARPADIGPPERNFPLPVVIGHGIFAVATLTLVLLTALGAFGKS